MEGGFSARPEASAVEPHALALSFGRPCSGTWPGASAVLLSRLATRAGAVPALRATWSAPDSLALQSCLMNSPQLRASQPHWRHSCHVVWLQSAACWGGVLTFPPRSGERRAATAQSTVRADFIYPLPF